ncbi:MAG: hypothetical protein GWN00_06535, partial [Aliifodinibius sp.]|nr:hypothetical protein [Fodinibius sp.]NIV10882.1 hypothetical protein [Fodinibius sp.]NIY24473.1 hypothetical protein [Fodinibius sp.]
MNQLFANGQNIASWLVPPPDLVNWNGVRELPFEIDPDLNFLKTTSHSSDPEWSWPLEFMLQVAFTSPPAFLQRNIDPEDYYDDSPWE